MTAEQTAHIDGIVEKFAAEARAKYADGQRRHGGNLWAKPGVMRMLREETLDFVVYADTLEQQLRDVLRHIENGEQQIAWQQLSGILDGPTD